MEMSDELEGGPEELTVVADLVGDTFGGLPLDAERRGLLVMDDVSSVF